MYILLLSLKMTWQNFAAAKLRTFLTVLGIIIGIASVVIVMSVGNSAQNVLLDQVRQIGSNLIAVLPGASSDDGPPAIAFGIITKTLTNADVDQIRNKLNFPHVDAVAGYVSSTQLVASDDDNKSVEVQGTSADMINVENVTIDAGRFFSPQEDAQRVRVAVLGAEISEHLFPFDSPLGKNITIKKVNYRVVGTMKKRGASIAGNFDEAVYVPLSVAQQNIMGVNYLTFARLRVDDEKNIAQTEEDIRTLLKSRHGIPQEDEGDFSVRNLASAVSILSDITNVMKYFLVTVAGISLIVGGIGVMNMMLITLNKRVSEIGLRVALGARKQDIAAQFLFESITIAIMGGTVGSIIGAGVAEIVGLVALNFDIAWTVTQDWSIYLTAFGIAGGIGIIFGIYPAIKAMKISPMEALRYE